ncbi:hypothetical protein, partial [Pseudomonas viridiflava]|uniref:hypothetical protein n=1 Tax=Pseudomonas viridiflava TaxID=33069 RepID=UPI001980BAD8
HILTVAVFLKAYPLLHWTDIKTLMREEQLDTIAVRDAKARILADDVVRLRRELHDHQEVEAGRKSERIVLTERLDQTRVRQQHVEQSMVGDDVDRART